MALLQQQMTRFHQSVRPRYSNPTFASTNLGSTLGMHVPLISRNLENMYNYSLNKPYPHSNITASKPVQANEVPVAQRSNSQLSNIGTSSLRNLNRYISDKQVYQKQQKNYNIISVQPKEYEDTIKVYPKYRLQNQDRNYYRKMQLQNEIHNKMNTNRTQRQLMKNPQKQYQTQKINRKN